MMSLCCSLPLTAAESDCVDATAVKARSYKFEPIERAWQDIGI